MPPTLYLIDGHALAYRTFFALTAGSGTRFSTADGEPTAGVFGFTSVLLRLLEQDKPDYLAVAFDGGHSFRDEYYPEYKATRAKMPDDLRTQMVRIREMVDAFGIPRLELDGYEADDILGSIAVQAVKEGLGVKIITGDRDLLQLVNERVMVNLAGSKLAEAQDYLPEQVKSYLGVRPDQVVDYKALVGDTSDNIPGVSGVGEKTAVSLLEQYDTLDEIYAHLDDLPARVKTRLEAGRESAYLSQRLALIRTDLEITLDLAKARVGQQNIEQLEALFKQLEFRTLWERLRKVFGLPPTPGPAAAPKPAPGGQLSLFESSAAPGGELSVERVGTAPGYQVEAQVVDSTEKLADLVKTLAAADAVAFDTESTSTDPLLADLVGISLAVKPGEGFYIPVGHRTGETQLLMPQVLDALRPVMSDPRKPKVGQNLKYDVLMLRKCGLEVDGLAFDTMIAQWLIDPSSHNLGLKDMAEVYLGERMTHIEELIGKGKAQRSMAEVTVAEVAPYAAADAEVTLRLKPLLEKGMTKTGADRLFAEMEMPLVAVLADMEWNGILLDLPFFTKMNDMLSTRLAEIEKEVYALVGKPFNINSTQQLSDVLFGTLRLEPPDRRKKTASGHFSTSADVLEELRGKHPVVDLILENRELAKLRSTYVDALPQQIAPFSGRVHTSFNQTGSVTGRLASSNPNLQNIPTRTELGRQVRNGFIAQPGWKLLSIDYSQIELRIVAHAAQDEAMLAAFRAGQDIHATTAAAVYGVPLEQVDKSMRRHAKAINFGLIYGMSAFGLSRSTELTLAEAEDFVKAYFQKFPGVKRYLDETRALAARQGYVETLLGRRRYFPNLASGSNPALRGREEREAINAPIQGTAADIVKLAMIRLPAALEKARSRARLMLQVHDELVLEVPDEELMETARLVQKVMESAYLLSIPLETEARAGDRWGELTVLS
ncbi:MAG: DNA polymerase I [Anaerolineaceae bacterium]|nr:DNA polymerase I [Anaerolineaceae bacterium]